MCAKKKLLFFILFTIQSLSFSQQCEIIYVTPAGANSGPAGTKANPASIQYALTLVNTTNTRIHMRAGTYNISAPLNLVNGVTIEGGFDNQWRKSNGFETIISRDFSNPDPNPSRLVAMQGNNVSGFKLHDLTIRTVNAVGNGVSTYGLYLNGCSDYQIVRCKIRAGNATNGLAGANGVAGLPGAPGSAGENGDENGPCCRQGGVGGSGSFPGSNPGGDGGLGGERGTYTFPAGGSAPPGDNGFDAPGVGGGLGGFGGLGVDDRIISLNVCPRTFANDGTPGTGGANGINGTNGIDGVASFGAFYLPGNGTNGTNGTNAYGGGGGGGGGSQGYVVSGFGFDFNGSGAGGGGGGEGGQRGTFGTGGTGGGGSFGMYVTNNGANTLIQDSEFQSGIAGSGGAGGIGGAGGTGGAGGAGGGFLNCDVGAGGNGGIGGNGGKGGDGGRGTDGVSIALFQYTNGQPITIQNFNNLQQPIVTVNNSGCTNSPISFSTGQTGTINWFFGSGSNPVSGTGQQSATTYTTLGRKTFTMVWNGLPYTYTKLIDIYNDVLPVQPAINSTNNIICQNASGSFQSNVTANSYKWTVIGGNNNINVVQQGAALQTFNYIFTAPGDYWVILNTISECCGESFPDTFNVSVTPLVPPTVSIQSSVETNNNIVCQGAPVIFTALPVNAGTNPTYQWQVNGQNAGTNSPTFVSSSFNSGDQITLNITSDFGCSAGLTATSNAITVTVIDIPQVSCSADSTFTNLPTYFSADVTSGGLAPFTYSWNFGNGSTGLGQEIATIYTAPGFYNVQVDVTDANGCSNSCNLVVNIQSILKAGFNADIFNGCSPLTVNFNNTSVNAISYLWNFGDGFTSNQTNPSHTYFTPGTYNVTLNAFSGNLSDVQTVQNQVVVLPSPTANFQAFPEVIGVAGDSVYFADNSVDAWAWFWDFGDPASGMLNNSTLQNPVHFYATNGIYDVTLIVENSYGCTDSITKVGFIKISVGLDDLTAEFADVNIFPVPFNDRINLSIELGEIKDVRLSLMDMNGKLVQQEFLQNVISNSTLHYQWNLNKSISEGFYFLRIDFDDKPYFRKLIKSKF